MSKEKKNNKQVTTVSSASIAIKPTDNEKEDTEKVLVLGKWLSKLFKLPLEKANLISKTLLSLTGSILSMVAVILSLLKGLGVI